MPSVIPLAFSILLLASSVGAQLRVLGEHKARLRLGTAWKQQILLVDLRKDRFVYIRKGGFLSASRQVYVIVSELTHVLENRADLQRVFDEQVHAGHKAPVVISKHGGHLRGTRRFELENDGAHQTYRLELVSDGGLSYLFMRWSLKSHRTTLDKAVDELLAGFRFPKPSSAWARGNKPIRKITQIPGYQHSRQTARHSCARSSGSFRGKISSMSPQSSAYRSTAISQEPETYGRAFAWDGVPAGTA